jgi:hypothetical protein
MAGGFGDASTGLRKLVRAHTRRQREDFDMSDQFADEITVPNVKMSFDQLLGVIRQLDEPGRALIARALLESKMDDELSRLLLELSETPPADDITDAEIQAEVRAVRDARAR